MTFENERPTRAEQLDKLDKELQAKAIFLDRKAIALDEKEAFLHRVEDRLKQVAQKQEQENVEPELSLDD